MTERPNCENCGAMNIAFRIDKSYRCRRCGFDSRVDHAWEPCPFHEDGHCALYAMGGPYDCPHADAKYRETNGVYCRDYVDIVERHMAKSQAGQ